MFQYDTLTFIKILYISTLHIVHYAAKIEFSVLKNVLFWKREYITSRNCEEIIVKNATYNKRLRITSTIKYFA